MDIDDELEFLDVNDSDRHLVARQDGKHVTIIIKADPDAQSVTLSKGMAHSLALWLTHLSESRAEDLEIT